MTIISIVAVIVLIYILTIITGIVWINIALSEDGILKGLHKEVKCLHWAIFIPVSGTIIALSMLFVNPHNKEL